MIAHFLSVIAGTLALAVASPALAAKCSIPAQVPVDRLKASVAAASDERARAALNDAAQWLAEGRADRALSLIVGLSSSPTLDASSQSLARSLEAVARSALGEITPSAKLAREAIGELPANTPPRLRSAITTNAALALSEAGDSKAAAEALERAALDAQAAGDARLEAIARVDSVMLLARVGADVATAATRAGEAAQRVGDPAERATLHLNLGLALLPESPGGSVTAADRLAAEFLDRAYRDASQAKSARDMAAALGLAGELRLARGAVSEAIQALERALVLSRAAADDPWRFRWLWKLGAARRAAGDLAGAERDLEQSVAALDAAKSARALGRFSSGSLARNYRGAYVELADLLLTQAGADQQLPLKRARDVIERSRASEVEDYFRDPCVTASARQSSKADEWDASVAVVYPIALPNRLDIVVGHRGQLRRFSAPVTSVALAREVQRLRAAVERPGGDRYLAAARRLNGWLVAPMREHLLATGAKTVVFIPDGAVRGLPFAALHDGEKHLVERFAIAVAPVASLVDTRPVLAADQRRAALTGLTESREGFDPLPAVAGELKALSGLVKGTVLQDKAFTVSALRAALERAPVSLIHVASHGQFSAEATESFLLAYDGRFTLPQLREALSAARLREEPVELLTLSACQTAAGDERAALGLAGVALSAGARSALATLWSVNDESTAALVTDFYRRLVTSGASKADALRGAQLAMLKDERFSHPAFWAPFLLIGSWL